MMIALGTHRPMTDEEIKRKFGEDISQQYSILNHNWWDPSQLIYLGETEGNSYLCQSIVENTISSWYRRSFLIEFQDLWRREYCSARNLWEETTGKTHWLSAQIKGREILGKIENPVKQEIERVAQKVGLKWIINTIQDGFLQIG